MKREKWTEKELYEEALKYKSRVALKKGTPSAYNAAKRLGILDRVCSHMKPIRHTWDTYGSIKKEALKYKSKAAFIKGCHGAYKAATRLGILDKVCSHMKPLHDDWSDIKKIHKAAKKYLTRTDFSRKNNKAYKAAQRLGILGKTCAHMDIIYKDWSDFNDIHKEALKYDSRGDFAINGTGAYMAATKMGILEFVCSHMKLGSDTSKAEKELFNIIKTYFFSVKKIKDRKVKIEGKPYIKGFHIDIYVPELNLGIEFDGRRYHSFEHMRKDKNKGFWSDDDIRNYHEIKDAWFATKGIKILHIKEEDWRKDKQRCIDSCLEFLEISLKKVV